MQLCHKVLVVFIIGLVFIPTCHQPGTSYAQCNQMDAGNNWMNTDYCGDVTQVARLSPAIVGGGVPTGGTPQSTSYVFNAWNDGNPGLWDSYGERLVDGDEGTWGRDNDTNDYIVLTGNSCPGTNLGTITSVTIAVLFDTSAATRDFALVPYFGGSSAGDSHASTTNPAEGTPAWSEEFDITTDTNAPSPWSWTDVQNLDARFTLADSAGRLSIYSVRITVNYTG